MWQLYHTSSDFREKSKSSNHIFRLQSCNPSINSKNESDHIAILTKRMLEARDNGIWYHFGMDSEEITGNDKADTLANIGR